MYRIDVSKYFYCSFCNSVGKWIIEDQIMQKTNKELKKDSTYI